MRVPVEVEASRPYFRVPGGQGEREAVLLALELAAVEAWPAGWGQCQVVVQELTHLHRQVAHVQAPAVLLHGVVQTNESAEKEEKRNN